METQQNRRSSAPPAICPKCGGQFHRTEPYTLGYIRSCFFCGYTHYLDPYGNVALVTREVEESETTYEIRPDRRQLPRGLCCSLLTFWSVPYDQSRRKDTVQWTPVVPTEYVVAVYHYQSKTRTNIYTAEILPDLPFDIGDRDLSTLRRLIIEGLAAKLRSDDTVKASYTWSVEQWGTLLKKI